MSNGISAVFHWKKCNCRHGRIEKSGRDGEPDSVVPARKKEENSWERRTMRCCPIWRMTNASRPVQPAVLQGTAGGGRGRAGGGIRSISWEAGRERRPADAKIWQGTEDSGAGEPERCELHYALAHHGL